MPPSIYKLLLQYGHATSMICDALASEWSNKTNVNIMASEFFKKTFIQVGTFPRRQL